MARQPRCDDEILEAIWEHWRKYCQPPSLPYLCDKTCISAKSAMFHAIRRLQTEGHVKVVNGKAIPVAIYQVLREM